MNTTGPTPQDYGDPAGASAAPPTHPPSGSAPPTQRDQYEAEPRRPVWPTPLGIIAIVFGGLGILFGVWPVMNTLIFVVSSIGAANPAAAKMQQIMPTAYQLIMLAIQVAYLVLAVLLLVAGIQLLRRRPNAWRQSIMWAVLKMITVVIGTVAGYIIQQQVMAQISQATQQQMPGFPISGMASMFQSMMLVVMVAVIVWGWALPVFILIWMTREKVKSDVAQWEKGASM